MQQNVENVSLADTQAADLAGLGLCLHECGLVASGRGASNSNGPAVADKAAPQPAIGDKVVKDILASFTRDQTWGSHTGLHPQPFIIFLL